MKDRTIKLAEQLLGSVPKDEVVDLIRLLEYYNRFSEDDRVKAMKNGSTNPKDQFLESQVIEEMVTFSKRASANSYVTTNQGVCRLCGR